MVIGGFAVYLYGHDRFTKDLDIVIDFNEDNLKVFKTAIESISYRMFAPVDILKLSEKKYRDKLKTEKNVVVLSLISDIYRDLTIDILLYIPFDFDTVYEKRIKIETEDDFNIDLIDVESLIAMKEETKRPHDTEDVRVLRKIYEEK